MVILGRVAGLHGVRGEFKVYSYTRPREGILEYERCYFREDGRWIPRQLVAGKRHGKTVIASAEGITDRDQAARLMNSDIAVPRSELPALREGEYYWVDLIGLEVRTTGGVVLGRVASLLETGAHDVLEVHGERSRLIPFVQGQVVRTVDLEAGEMVVDWDPDF